MKGIELKNTKIVNTCRSGMTACMIYFAEELLGVKDKVIYDGSWTEFVFFVFNWLLLLF